jgi:hypothetical protein
MKNYNHQKIKMIQIRETDTKHVCPCPKDGISIFIGQIKRSNNYESSNIYGRPRY